MANRVILIGRMARDPEVRYVSEKAVCNFTLAVERPMKNAAGKHDADFIPCVAWGKIGELVGNYVHKGNKIYVEGRLQVRSYEDKENNKRYITEVNVASLEFLEKANTTQGAAEKNSTAGQPAGFGSMGEAIPESEFEGLVF